MTYTMWEIIIWLLVFFLLGALLVYLWMRRGSGSEGSSAADQETIATLRADLQAAKSKQATLESDLDACMDARAQLESNAGAKAKAAPKSSSKAKAKAEPFTTDAPKPEAFAGAAAAAAKANPDDLKKIWGVGPVMESVLNDHGCYTFEQVANLSDRDVEWVAANINTFPDRITRDDWVGQAKKLAAEKS